MTITLQDGTIILYNGEAAEVHRGGVVEIITDRDEINRLLLSQNGKMTH